MLANILNIVRNFANNIQDINMDIRKATLDDACAICNIYNYYIENTAITFETTPLSESGMKQRIKDVIDSGYSFYVGEAGGKIIGYYYTHRWNNRCAYATTVEDSIYLDKDETGKGYGSQLFEHLLAHIDKNITHVLIAGICIPNEASVRLHEKFGFKQISHMKEIGRKFGQWRDVGHWQLIIPDKKKILVLCTGNSCRSQIAEGYLRHFAGDKAEVYSAGVETHGVNPDAIEVMKEDGIDISGHTSNNVDEYRDIDFDFVITVCDNARERCPYIPTKAVKFHQNFPDPAKAQGTKAEIKAEFIRVRDMIKDYCKQFVEENIK